MLRLFIVLLLGPFTALTAAALWQDGYLAIFAVGLESLAGAQVFVDLVIALLLILVWIWHDARRIGRNPWPWIIATFALGGFGPLLYLLTRPMSPPPG